MKNQIEVQKANGRKTTSLVKKMLKDKFNINCSVQSSTYSMGSSINISYDLGPDQKIIDSLLSGLQYGHFNGMEDIYENNSDHQGIVYDGYQLEEFKFCFVRQQISNELNAKLKDLYLGVMGNDMEDYKKDQEFYRHFKVKNFITQDESKINVIKAVFNYDEQQIEFIYSVDGVEYNTSSLEPIAKAEAVAEPVKEVSEKIEVVPGEISIIDYSEKAIAIVGDTKPIKEKLKALGGKFNPHLKCGAGWIFAKKRQSDVISILSA